MASSLQNRWRLGFTFENATPAIGSRSAVLDIIPARASPNLASYPAVSPAPSRRACAASRRGGCGPGSGRAGRRCGRCRRRPTRRSARSWSPRARATARPAGPETLDPGEVVAAVDTTPRAARARQPRRPPRPRRRGPGGVGGGTSAGGLPLPAAHRSAPGCAAPARRRRPWARSRPSSCGASGRAATTQADRTSQHDDNEPDPIFLHLHTHRHYSPWLAGTRMRSPGAPREWPSATDRPSSRPSACHRGFRRAAGARLFFSGHLAGEQHAVLGRSRGSRSTSRRARG